MIRRPWCAARRPGTCPRCAGAIRTGQIVERRPDGRWQHRQRCRPATIHTTGTGAPT